MNLTVQIATIHKSLSGSSSSSSEFGMKTIDAYNKRLNTLVSMENLASVIQCNKRINELANRSY